jgi:tyrosyl-tRNA synthetase
VAREIQKEAGHLPQCVLTFPLLVGTDGVNKMSKSLGNYIGITESPREIYGKTMSISDELMRDYFQLTLGYSKEDLDTLFKNLSKGKIHPRDLKARLARELVTLYHNSRAAKDAEEEFNRIFQCKELPDEIKEKILTIDKKEISLVNILSKTGLASSGREARRLITGGGVYVDNNRMQSPESLLSVGEYIIKVGKRRFIKVTIATK